MEKKIKEIVITGGPCSGKTTALSYISEKLQDWGFRVFIAREVATDIITGGVSDIGWLSKNNPSTYLKIQEQILLEQRALRKIRNQIASLFVDDKCVILFDRGEMDNMAYLPQKKYFEQLLKKLSLTLHDVRDSYDGVVHLVSAAEGAERFYTTENNPARREISLQAARQAEKKTKRVWLGHSHFRIIDNSTDFEGKMRRLLQAICRILGIPVPLEIERKFLLKQKPHFNRGPLRNSQKIQVEQMYLASLSGQQIRIRKRSQGGSSSYYRTQKTIVSPRVRQETESFITASEYARLSAIKNPDTEVIEKERHCFIYKNQYFELDVFLQPPLVKGLCLLEIELTEENDKVELPPFLDIEKEVTEDPSYTNFEISKRR